MESKNVVLAAAAIVVLMSFQNCSKVGFQENKKVTASSVAPMNCEVNGTIVASGASFNIPSGFTSAAVAAGTTCIQDAYQGSCLDGTITLSHQPASLSCAPLAAASEPAPPVQRACTPAGEAPYKSGSLGGTPFTHCFTASEEKQGLYIGKVVTPSTSDVYTGLQFTADTCCSKSMIVSDLNPVNSICSLYGVATIVCQ
ncbi:MAG: hypothetical protein ACXVCY_13650 [Pseudobdellovibrionaceae bacterium]